MTPEALAELSGSLPQAPVLTVEQVAKFLMLPRSTAYKACTDGTIPAIKVHRNIRIPRQPFIEWCAAQSEMKS